jgi:phage/plasmid-like protein (TIGR03299 family)
MAHEVEQMFYMGATPWHGLGVKLDTPPTVDEAIIAAGLDWRVERKPLVLAETGERAPAFATVRSSDNQILGVVGKGYRVLQNRDAFAWFQPYLDSGEVELHTAGSLRGGKHVWVLAQIKTEAPVEIVRGDEVLQFALLSNSHDGSQSIRCGLTGVRVVCANTIAAAHNSSASKLVRIRHSDNAVLALDKVRESLDLARREFAATADSMRIMARYGCDEGDLRKYVQEVFATSADTTDTDVLERLCGKVIPLFEAGRGTGVTAARGNMWGAYNAVTEYLSWEKGRSVDTRLESTWFGENAKIAQRAFDVALAQAA